DGSKYWITGDSGYVSRFEQARAQFEADLTALAALDLSADERVLLDSLTALWPRLFPPEAGLASLIAVHAGVTTAAGTGFDVWLDEATRQLRDRTTAIYRASERAMEAEVAASLAAGR